MQRYLFAAALAALGTSPAYSDNESGLYLGVGAGQFNVSIDHVDTLDDVEAAFDGDETVWKAFAGWRFAPFIAVEVAYLDLGKPDDTVEGSRVETELSGVAPYVIGTLPLGPIELFAKVGYYFYDVKINGESVVRVDESDEDLVYGAGAGLTLFEHLHARLEYELIDASRVNDSDVIWLSGAWRF